MVLSTLTTFHVVAVKDIPHLGGCIMEYTVRVLIFKGLSLADNKFTTIEMLGSVIIIFLIYMIHLH